MRFASEPPHWQRWAVVLASVALITALRGLLHPLLGAQLPVLLYVLAVLVSAWFGGFWPGLAAGVLSLAVSTAFFFSPSPQVWGVASAPTVVRLAAFSLVTLGVSAVCATMRRAMHTALALAGESARRREQTERESQEHKRTAAALARSETEFRTLFELAPLGMLQVEHDEGRIQRVNPTLCELLGYTEAELLNLRFLEITHPDDRSQSWANFQAAVTGTASTFQVEKRYLRKDGQTVWAVTNVRVFREENGVPRMAIAVINDITARKAVEQAFQNREIQLRQVADNLPDGFLYQVIASTDGTRKFVYLGAGVERITGISVAEGLVHAASLYSIIHPADVNTMLQEEARCVSGQCHFDVTFRMRHRGTGEWRWAQIRSAPRRGTDGTTVWDGLFLDVTSTRETQEALRRSQERLSLAQRAGGIGVFDWDVQSGTVEWSEEEHRIFGLAPGEFGGTFERAMQLIHPDDAGAMQQSIANAMARGEAEMDFAFRILTPQNQFRWVEGAARIVYGEDRTPLRMVGVNLDATARHEAEVRLQQSEAKFRTIVDSAGASNIGILRSHADGRILEANDAFLRIVGYTREDFRAGLLNWYAMTPPEHLEKDAQETGKIRETKQSRSFEKEYFRKDGSRVPIILSGNFAPGGEDEFICFIVDLTEQKRAEQELREAKEVAETASKAKDHFLAVLSHELRTPLAPVVPLLGELIDHGNLPPPVTEDLLTIRRNIILEARLIDDLLDLTRVLRGKLELRHEVVNLHQLLEQAIAVCRTDEVSQKGAVIKLQWNASAAYALGDSVRLQQVFWNLINNACKFTRPGTVVTVRTSNPQPGHIVVEVLDQGIGISQNLRDRLFEPFEQGDRHFGTERRGLGLGLAITKSLVEAHHGTISVTSPGLGQGATFQVLLPVTSAPPVVESSVTRERFAPSHEVAHPNTKRRILLVEDHVDTARVMERLLKARGYHVRLATTQAGAEQLLREHEFDLLVSDLGLPDGSGLALMEHVRKSSPLQGIALSGFGTEADLRRSQEAGFVTHLVKPVDFSRLLETLREVLAP